MALALILATAWAEPPSGPDELADADLEARRTLRRCEASQASGLPCREDAETLADATLTVAIASLVLEGRPHPAAIADTWALAPQVAERWEELLGRPTVPPSAWVAGVLDPSSIQAPPPRSPPTEVPVAPERDASGAYPLPLGANAMIELGVHTGRRSYAGAPGALVAGSGLTIQVPLGPVAVRLAARGQLIRQANGAGDTREGFTHLDAAVPLRFAHRRRGLQTQLHWTLGVEGWTEGSTRRMERLARDRSGSSVPSRWGLGPRTGLSFTFVTPRSRVRLGHTLVLLHRWFPRTHLDAARGPAYFARDRWGVRVENRVEMMLQARLTRTLAVGPSAYISLGDLDADLFLDPARTWLSPRGIDTLASLVVSWVPGVERP